MPASSRVSRRTASSIASPGSTKPARHDQHAAAKRAGAAEQAALAGDRQHDHDRVGAREMLRPAGRAVAPPAGLDRAGRRAAIASRSDGAHASRAAPCLRRAAADGRASTSPRTAIERRSVTTSSSRVLSASIAAGSSASANRAASSHRPRKTDSAGSPKRARLAALNSGSRPVAVFFSTTSLAADRHSARRARRSPAPQERPRRRAARRRARSGLRYSRAAAWGRDRGEGTCNYSGGAATLGMPDATAQRDRVNRIQIFLAQTRR